MIIYVSDLDMKKSGYMNLGVRVASALSKHDKTLYLGWDYRREEHNYPFSAVPLTGLQHVAPICGHLKPQMICVALDVPLQIGVIQSLNQSNINVPYVGIFPLEAKPLQSTWASWLWAMKHRFVLSLHGQRACEAAGLPATFLPIPIEFGDDVNEQWKYVTPDDRELARSLFNLKDKFVVLTVADNHERKNLVKGFEIVAELVKRGLDVQYFIVTRVGFPGGFDLDDLKARFNLQNRVTFFNRGLAHDKLWGLYAMSDVFLLPSKAEGAGVPILEAMACGIPVAGTRVAAIEDHLSEGRGLPIEYDYQFIDPFGNSDRVFVSVKDGADKLAWLANATQEEKNTMRQLAFEYVTNTYNENNMVNILDKELKGEWQPAQN